MKTCLSVALLSVVLLAGCRDREAEAAAQAAAQAAASEAAADEAARAFEAAVADGNWALAKAQGDLLFAKWPTTDAAGRVRDAYEEAKARGDAEIGDQKSCSRRSNAATDASRHAVAMRHAPMEAPTR